jgi:hypothetical protein
MDLRLFLRVAARFKLLMAIGAVLALSLATMSYVRIEFDGGRPSLTYRSQEQWVSYTRLLLTQPGFKWGNSLASPGNPNAEIQVGEQAAVEGRLPTLATIYATFVTSDPVMRLILRGGPVRGAIQAQALPSDPNGNGILPIVNISATGNSLGASQELADRAATALRAFVNQQQRTNAVPEAQRIELRYLNRGGLSELVSPRKKTVPVIVFLFVMFAAIALAFVLDNLRPPGPRLRIEPAPQQERHRAIS